MGEWPHCPNGCGPLEVNYGRWCCPDCNYTPSPSEYAGDGFPEAPDDE